MWLGKKNLQLYRALGLEYIRKLFGKRYEINNYNNSTKYKSKDENYEKIRQYLIIGLEEYNIQ